MNIALQVGFHLEPIKPSCIMPSLQTALPRELANNAIGVGIGLTLYRECLRRAKYIGSKFSRAEVRNIFFFIPHRRDDVF
ncbi:hypothetical protein KY284_001293 [Solanum tuberosum]|nr:hypothetical protein KY284_001293 [Solanum tuberosum]